MSIVIETKKNGYVSKRTESLERDEQIVVHSEPVEEANSDGYDLRYDLRIGVGSPRIYRVVDDETIELLKEIPERGRRRHSQDTEGVVLIHKEEITNSKLYFRPFLGDIETDLVCQIAYKDKDKKTVHKLAAIPSSTGGIPFIGFNYRVKT